MKVKRTVKNGRLRIYGRTYRIPDYVRDDLPEGSVVWVSDDEVICNQDNPESGLYTAKTVPIYWPKIYMWFTRAKLDESEFVRKDRNKVGDGCFQILEEITHQAIREATEKDFKEVLGEEGYAEAATRGRAIVDKAIKEVEANELKKAVGEPMVHPVTGVAGWNWMANHIASMRCPYQSDHQNINFIAVQERVVKLLRDLAVVNIKKGNVEDE
jgi:hypothetical protein